MYLYKATGILLINFLLLFSLNAANSLDAKYSEKTLRDFGLQLEESLSSRNPYYFNISFATDQLLNNVFEQYGISPDRAFHNGFVDGIKNNLDLGSLLVNDLNAGGSIELITVQNCASSTSLIFRLIGSNGINYHEYFIEEVAGNLKITDAYLYSTGQRISETVGELYLTSWLNMDSEYSESVKVMKALHAEGKYKKAYQKWNNLSLEAKTKKSNLITAMDITARIDKDAFYEAYNLFTLHYPNEPGKYLIPLDGLIASGLYERALENIDSLDKIVHADPILNFVRANIYYEAQKVEKAEKCLNLLIETMPNFELGYFGLLEIYLQDDRYEYATELLNQMIVIFQNYKEDYIPMFANYPEFVKSYEYKNWLQQ